MCIEKNGDSVWSEQIDDFCYKPDIENLLWNFLSSLYKYIERLIVLYKKKIICHIYIGCDRINNNYIEESQTHIYVEHKWNPKTSSWGKIYPTVN